MHITPLRPSIVASSSSCLATVVWLPTTLPILRAKALFPMGMKIPKSIYPPSYYASDGCPSSFPIPIVPRSFPRETPEALPSPSLCGLARWPHHLPMLGPQGRQRQPAVPASTVVTPCQMDEVGGKEDDNHGYTVGQLKAQGGKEKKRKAILRSLNCATLLAYGRGNLVQGRQGETDTAR